MSNIDVEPHGLERALEKGRLKHRALHRRDRAEARSFVTRRQSLRGAPR